MTLLEAAFWNFHRANPNVYAELVRLARVWRKRHGDRRLGIKMLWEVMRWNIYVEVEANAGDEWKLCNNHTAYYARLIMAQEPDLAEAFQLRRLSVVDEDSVFFSDGAE